MMSKSMVNQDDQRKWNNPYAQQKKSIEERFWEKVDKHDGNDIDWNECWEWLGGKDTCGYGKFRTRKNPKRDSMAHRYSWELTFGKIPNGYYVCHHCDNPSCVRPGHLFLGSQKDNMQDMINKNRSPNNLGENNPRCKLTRKDVIKIRNLYGTGDYYQYELGMLFGVTQSQIHAITSRKQWKHV